MQRRRKRRPPGQPPCREQGSDDGIDPRTYFRDEPPGRGRRRKTLQLSAQVARAVSWALAEAEDERLLGLHVARVEPAPDARRLKVVLQQATEEDVPRTDLDVCLAHALPRIRAAVADAIHRRKTPELLLVVERAEETP